MTTREPNDIEIECSEQVRAEMEQNPELAQAVREMCAAFRQAYHAVATGQHKSFEDAVEAITGRRPQPFDDNGE